MDQELKKIVADTRKYAFHYADCSYCGAQIEWKVGQKKPLMPHSKECRHAKK